MKTANVVLSVVVFAQLVLCVLSAGFSPTILGAFALMLAAPFSFIRSMEVHGVILLLLPVVAGILLFPGIILSPVFFVWFAIIVVASAVCWNRGGKPPISAADSWGTREP